MKTVYKKISISSRNFVLTISLLVSLIAMASGEAASGTVNVESLDGLQVSLVSSNVSGAEKLTTDDTKAHYYAGNDNDLVCHLNNLAAGTHRLTVKVTLGTNTYVLAVVDIVVAANADGEIAEDSMNLTAVKSFGDGSGGGDVPACYGVDEGDNAHITTPLSVGDAVASGDGAVASGYVDDTEGGQIVASAEGSTASGYVNGERGQITASGQGAAANGRVEGFSAEITASAEGSTASGNVNGESSQITASGQGATANGVANDVNAGIIANGSGATASGSANGENSRIIASGNGAVANGNASGEGSQIVANGSGATASGYANGDNSRITASGAGAGASGHANDEGAEIIASGDSAIARGFASGAGSQIVASGPGAVASGYVDNATKIIASGYGATASGRTVAAFGDIVASGPGSQAFGLGTKAVESGQMVVGQCNVPDLDGDYQFIVGNGADDEHRHNAFAVTKAGELALFKADGTPVTLSVAQLEALIAMLPPANA